MFKKKYSKWIALGKWNWDGKEYVVMARRNLKNGMLKFKSVRVNSHFWGYSYPVLPNDIIDTKKAWDELVL